MDDDFSYGKLSVSRHRPTHVIPPKTLKRVVEGFPIRNRIVGSDNLEIRWKTGRWSALAVDLAQIQARVTCAAFFRSGQLLGAVEFFESRNATKHVLSSSDFHYICDNHSQEMANYAWRIIQALERLDGGRKRIDVKEAFVEIEGLYLLPEACSTKPVWPDLLNALIFRKYDRSEDFTVLIMHPFPLEYRGYDEKTEGHFRNNDRLFQRRVKAMTRFYEHIFRVTAIDDQEPSEIWLGRLLGL